MSDIGADDQRAARRMLVTGGTGFIGSRLALHCRSEGWDVRVLGMTNTPAEAANRRLLAEREIEVVLGSVTEITPEEGLFDTVDTVFHLAAAQHEMNIPDSQFSAVNVEGTRRVLEAGSRAGVRRVVHGSTIGVYGELAGTIDETSPCRPDNIYGRTKLEGERLALDFSDRLPVVVVRIPEVYGPGDRRLLKLFRGVYRRRFLLIGNGDNLHHPIYVDDLVGGLVAAALCDAAVNEVFLLAGPEAITTAEMISAVAAALDRRPPRLRLPLTPFIAAATLFETTLRPLGIQPPLHRRRLDFFRKSFALSAAKARRTFGFVPSTDFEEGARRTAAWYHQVGLL